MGIRDRAKEILSVVPPIGQQVTSVGATAGLFTQLTGTTQATLEQNWAGGGKMTTCNGFTGWFGNQLGSKLYLGRFDLDTYLPKNGKGDAWIKSTPDNRPKYGDICRFSKFHVGVSLDFEGDIWTHCDSGQGGRSAGCDIIKRIRDKDAYSYQKLLGWVDIEIYFGESSAADATAEAAGVSDQLANPVPDWLQGWWDVRWRGQAFYYYFDRSREVGWTQTPPIDRSRPSLLYNDKGKLAIGVPNALSIVWNKTGSIEKFENPLNTPNMRGIWNEKEPLAATKM